MGSAIASSAPIPQPARQPTLQPAPPPPRVSAQTADRISAAPLAAPLPGVKPPLASPGLGAKEIMPLDSKLQLVTRIDGKTAGAVDFQQTPGGLKVRLGSIAEVLADRYDPAQIARIRGSAAGNAYLSLAELQAQGVPISYDPVYDEFNIGTTDTRPKAARKAHMDQITVPERGSNSTAIDQIRR